MVLFCGCGQQEHGQINGVSLVASPEKLSTENVAEIQQLHANYVSVMPIGFVRSLNHPEISYDNERQWFGETKAGVKQYIQELHQQKLNVFLKPHIWIWHGEYTGDLQMKTEADWKTLETSYQKFILDFAHLAEENQVELFCIGTEMHQFVKQRPQFWKQLIQNIKKVYHGKLTYASNWDEYQDIPFWKGLDFIGVDAYFPISSEKTPTVNQAKKGWAKWKEVLQKFSAKEKRKILFTEYGYRSIDFAGKQPWNSDRNLTSVNQHAQKNLTQAVLETFWNEPWFAGGFVWKWYSDSRERDWEKDTRFTPQHKSAEEVIQQAYEN